MLKTINSYIKKNAGIIRAKVVDLYAAFKGREEELLCFGIEPNLKGATEIARLFKAAYVDSHTGQ